jgi:hypothetical protein
MTSFTVVYQFICSNCRFVNSGKKTVQAEDAEQASHIVGRTELPCRNCHLTAKSETMAQTLVFPATDQELPEFGTGPAVPRT